MLIEQQYLYVQVISIAENLDHIIVVEWIYNKKLSSVSTGADYADKYKLDVPRGYPGVGRKLPVVNHISKTLFGVTKKMRGNKHHISTLFMTFGQFLDHDITDTPSQACQVRKYVHIFCLLIYISSTLITLTLIKANPFYFLKHLSLLYQTCTKHVGPGTCQSSAKMFSLNF